MSEFYNVNNEVYRKALQDQQVFPIFKIQLLDYQERVVKEIQDDILLEEGGTIEVNYAQGVRRTCNIVINNSSHLYTPSPNGLIWFNTKIRVFTGIKVPKYTLSSAQVLNYTVSKSLDYMIENNLEAPILTNDKLSRQDFDYYWFSQGVFVLTNPTLQRDMSLQTINLTGVDKFGLFGAETGFNALDGTYKIPAGTNIDKCIRDILLLDKGNGEVYDSKPLIAQPIYDESGNIATTPYTIEKAPNVFFSEMLTEMANSYAMDIYYDINGTMRFEKGNEQRYFEDFPSIWDFTDKQPEYFEPQVVLNFVDTYNEIKVIGNNPNSETTEFTVQDTNPASETRVSLIGRKPKYFESTFCYNQDRTIDFARYLLKKYSMVQNSLDFKSTIIPHLDVNQVVTVSDEYFNWSRQRFVIQSISIPISTKQLMQIKACNATTIPYFEY